MVHPVMLMVNADGKGQAIVGGRAYMVRAKFSETFGWESKTERRLTFTLLLEESLDEEAQRRRIAGLESELQRERERLDEIRGALADEEPAR